MVKRTVSTARLRAVRKELLCARAQLERRSLALQARQLSHDITPAALVRALVPTGKSVGISGRLLQGLGLLRRYPYLASAVSVVFSGLRRRRLWRAGAGVLLSLVLARGVKANKPGSP